MRKKVIILAMSLAIALMAFGASAMPAQAQTWKRSTKDYYVKVSKQKHYRTWCYIAHIRLKTKKGYGMFGCKTATGRYSNGKLKTSQAARKYKAILAINGDYTCPEQNYGHPVARWGKAVARGSRSADGAQWVVGAYCRWNGKLYVNGVGEDKDGTPLGVYGKTLNYLIRHNMCSDTFDFGPGWNLTKKIPKSPDHSRRQRTSIGTTGKKGEIYIIVSEGPDGGGMKSDGVSRGLTYRECALLLKAKGCKAGFPLDGGGSSTIVFDGKVLNSARSCERPIPDFIILKK